MWNDVVSLLLILLGVASLWTIAVLMMIGAFEFGWWLAGKVTALLRWARKLQRETREDE